MPLYYFIPFKFKSDAERKMETPVLDFGPTRELMLSILVGLVLFAMFMAFIVLPAIIVMQQSAVPAG